MTVLHLLLGIAGGLVVGYGAGRIGLTKIKDFFVSIFNSKKRALAKLEKKRQEAGDDLEEARDKVKKEFEDKVRDSFKVL